MSFLGVVLGCVDAGRGDRGSTLRGGLGANRYRRVFLHQGLTAEDYETPPGPFSTKCPTQSCVGMIWACTLGWIGHIVAFLLAPKMAMNDLTTHLVLISTLLHVYRVTRQVVL